MNKIVKGDVVRFLNAVGGGTVSRVDEKKGLIYVEDQDGFEIPVLIRECVLVPQVNEKTNFPLKNFGKNTETASQISENGQSEIKQIVREPEIEIIETKEGDTLQCFLTFIPHDVKNLQTCPYDCVLINDSNYFLFYNVITGEKDHAKSAANGIIEPNMQEDIAVLLKADLNDWEFVRVQIVAFKKGKVYEPQRVIDFETRISPVKLYKLHSFTENDYLDEPALLISLTDKKMPEISAADIQKAILEKEKPEPPKAHKRPHINLNPDVLEVDLHIHELLDDTFGLSNAEMLQVQLDKFHEVIAANSRKKGQKIVFIHGKGEGVLRNEILKLLKTRYKNFYYQDASFKEYGFGATMIVIR